MPFGPALFMFVKYILNSWTSLLGYEGSPSLLRLRSGMKEPRSVSWSTRSNNVKQRENFASILANPLAISEHFRVSRRCREYDMHVLYTRGFTAILVLLGGIMPQGHIRRAGDG